MKLIKLSKKQTKELSRSRIRLMATVSPFFSSILIKINTYFFTSDSKENTFLYKINSNNIWINADIFFNKKSSIENKLFILNHLALALSLLHPIRINALPSKNRLYAEYASFIICYHLLAWSDKGITRYTECIKDIAPFINKIHKFYIEIIKPKELFSFSKIYNYLLQNNNEKLNAFIKNYIATIQNPDNPSESVAASKAAEFIDLGVTNSTIQTLIKRVTINKVNWQKVLHNWFTSFTTSDKTFNRYDRRFIANESILPTLEGVYSINSIVCYIDTSASVLANELEYIYNEMLELKRLLGCEIQLATFNTKIIDRYTLSEDDNSIKDLNGRGGTSLTCVHEDILDKEQNKKSEDKNIYVLLSDLECKPMDKINNINMVTICTNNSKAKVNTGKLIHVEI